MSRRGSAPLPGTAEYEAMVARVAAKGPRSPKWRMEKVAALLRPVDVRYQSHRPAA